MMRLSNGERADDPLGRFRGRAPVSTKRFWWVNQMNPRHEEEGPAVQPLLEFAGSRPNRKPVAGATGRLNRALPRPARQG